jgi:hypothetical protein
MVTKHSTAAFGLIGVVVTIYTSIRDEPGSNLGQVICYEEFFLVGYKAV